MPWDSKRTGSMSRYHREARLTDPEATGSALPRRSRVIAPLRHGGAGERVTITALVGPETCRCRQPRPSRSLGLSIKGPGRQRLSVALSFLYLAFVRLLQLVRLFSDGQEELAIEVVMLRHEVAVLRRQVATPSASAC